MARAINMSKFATKAELEKHKKHMARELKKGLKEFAKQDVIQDKKLVKKSKKSKK